MASIAGVRRLSGAGVRHAGGVNLFDGKAAEDMGLNRQGSAYS